MKILALASTLDLGYRLGCTPSWWQLLKALREAGNEVIAIPYLGDPVETLWWRTYDNPCAVESKLFNLVSQSRFTGLHGRTGPSAALARTLIERHIRPRWRRHLFGVLGQEGAVDAVLMMNVPVNHFTGIPSALREEFGVRVAYYDGDMPTILPRTAIGRGFKFNYYDGADLGEYDAFFTNSKGAIPDIEALGAHNVHPLYWAVDPELFQPVAVQQDYDVSFFGYGDQLREEWMTKLIAVPSVKMPKACFTVGGGGFTIPLGRATFVGDVPYAAFARFVGRSKVNLNITRNSHTSVYASATSRPFELAALGASIVSQPYSGIGEWFDVGRELLVAKGPEEAVELYRWLLDDPGAAREMGIRARKRTLREHTFRHRAQRIMEVLGGLAS